MSGFDSPLAASAYEVLGVEASVSDDELRRAYRLRLRQTHPDTGGDAATFVLVQRAWELVGTTEARAAYDRGHGFGASAAPAWSVYQPPRRETDTRPGPRTHGQPGGWNREQYLRGIREWAGRGVELADPYDAALVRSAPRVLKQLLADALTEEATARRLSELGMGYTLWHDIALPRGEGKLDHVVLGPSGLYAMTSEDIGEVVRFKRGEVLVSSAQRAPIAHTVAAARAVGKAAGVRFGGALLVLPDSDVQDAITELGKVRSLPVGVVGESAVTTVLRRGLSGVRDLGGTEIFDVRTRLQQTLRFA